MNESLNGQATRPYFSMITDYNKMIEDLDKAFVWDKAIFESQEAVAQIFNQGLKKWTAMVFGECGQGKSTTLNEIVEIYARDYF